MSFFILARRSIVLLVISSGVVFAVVVVFSGELGVGAHFAVLFVRAMAGLRGAWLRIVVLMQDSGSLGLCHGIRLRDSVTLTKVNILENFDCLCLHRRNGRHKF